MGSGARASIVNVNYGWRGARRVKVDTNRSLHRARWGGVLPVHTSWLLLGMSPDVNNVQMFLSQLGSQGSKINFMTG